MLLIHYFVFSTNICWIPTMYLCTVIGHGDILLRNTVLCCSVAKLCPILSNSMDCCTPGSPVFDSLLEFAQIHVHWVDDANISSSTASFSFCFQAFPVLESFPMSWLFASGGQCIGVSASASVLPVNIQDWFPLGLTGLIPLQFKGPSRVFSNTTVQKHQSLTLRLLYDPTLTTIHDHWKNHSFHYTNLCQQRLFQ